MLEIQNLHVKFHNRDREAVSGVSLTIQDGEILGLVGESGSGKTVTAMMISGLLRPEQAAFRGQILLDGRDLLTSSGDTLRSIQGRDICVVFQEPMSAMDPTMRIGPQVEECLRVHTDLPPGKRRELALQALRDVDLPEAEEVDVEIDPKDLQIDTYRSSGAGGQHVNKTESAIRITHLPTGLVVECQDERSQYKNKDKAMKVLRSRLYERELARREEAEAASRRSQVGSGDRSERIRTYNFPQGRVTDHRIGLTLYKIDAILDGGLDELIDALVTADQAEKLRRGGEEA